MFRHEKTISQALLVALWMITLPPLARAGLKEGDKLPDLATFKLERQPAGGDQGANHSPGFLGIVVPTLQGFFSRHGGAAQKVRRAWRNNHCREC